MMFKCAPPDSISVIKLYSQHAYLSSEVTMTVVLILEAVKLIIIRKCIDLYTHVQMLMIEVANL